MNHENLLKQIETLETQLKTVKAEWKELQSELDRMMRLVEQWQGGEEQTFDY